MPKHVIRTPEKEASETTVASLLAHVRAGAEVVIEQDGRPVAALHAKEPPRSTIPECIALLPEDSTATIDREFAKDVEEIISNRKPWNPPAWE